MPIALHVLLILGGLFLTPPAARAQAVEFHVAYEDKDSHDHLGVGTTMLSNPGILVELVGMIEKKVPNLRIVFYRKPWVRCLAELEVGTVDGVFSSSFRPERMKLGIYPMLDGRDDRRYRIDTKSYSLYKLRDAPLTWDGRSFAHLQYGLIAIRSYAIVNELRNMGIAVKEVNSPDDAFRMLQAGRADGFAQLTDFGDIVLRKNSAFSGIVKSGPPIITRDYYLQISHQFNKRYPGMAEKIWKALAEVRQAEHERLLVKYLKLTDN